jgi:hypothetical protein
MKSKTKFDPKVIQQYLIDHTEKFVMGLIALAFLFFAYRSFVLAGSGYQKKPKDLADATQKAMATIDRGPTTHTAAKVCEFPPYASIIDAYKVSVDPAKYPTPLGFYPIVIPQPRGRRTPEVLPVEQLRAIAGRGAVAGPQNNAANGNIRGRRWIVVTGLVPYKKQADEYRAKFKDAAQYSTDVPNYVGYLVQRAEVVPGGKPDWKTFLFNAKRGAIKIGNQRGGEIAESHFVKPSLASPLPQLADTTWGNEAVCPPQIPFVEREPNSPDASPMGGHQPGDRGGRAHPPASGDARPHGGRDVSPRPGSGPMGAAGAAPNMDDDMDNPPPGTDNTKNGDAVNPNSAEEQAQVPDYFLLRYFDFDVEPNHQYQYRVFPILRNPSFGKELSVLEDPTVGEYQYLGVDAAAWKADAKSETGEWPLKPAAQWSAPCTSDRVPGDLRLLAGPVVPPSRAQPEITADARILIWQLETGRSGSFHKDNLARGKELKFPDAAVKTPGISQTSKVPLDPKCILVDAALGGDPLRDSEGHAASTGLILVLDNFGNLVLHDQVAEAKDWDEATKERTENQPRPPREGGRGGLDSRPQRIDDELDTGRTRTPHGRP